METKETIKKHKCNNCHKNIGAFDYNCHSCNKSFCIRCRLPEEHVCPNINNMKKEQHDKLAELLKNSATHDNHNLL